MKNFLIAIFTLFAISASAQVIQADHFKGKPSSRITISGYTIHGFSNDPALGDSSTIELVTEAAAKAYSDTKGRLDSLILLQDSILVAYDAGGDEIWRDTIAGTGGGSGDGNGIYSGSGTIPNGTVAKLDGTFSTFKYDYFDDTPAIRIDPDDIGGTALYSHNGVCQVFATNTTAGLLTDQMVLSLNSVSNYAAFTDTRTNTKGIEYFDDYSSGFTARSLVDKEYVDNAVAGAGGGTVTSVGLTMPSGFSVSGSPVTTSGTLAVTGTLNPSAGGTGLSSYAVGDLLYASGTATLSKLAAAASGNVLLSGTAPSWGKVGLATHVDGILPVANGGTGATSLTGLGGIYSGNGSTGGGMRVVDVPYHFGFRYGTGSYAFTLNNTGANPSIGFSSSTVSNYLTMYNDSSIVGTSGKGLQYAGNYASGFTARSLVDKAYVDAAISAGGDGNGIYSGSGTLTNDVTVTGANKDINFSSIGDFTVTQQSSTGTANAISMTAGNQTSGSGTGGAVTITAGNGTSSGGIGGAVTITAGRSTSTTGTAGSTTISGGRATGSNSLAGNLKLEGGDGTATNTIGGDVIIEPGTGTDADGRIFLYKPGGSISNGAIQLDVSGLGGGLKTATFQNASGTIAYLSDISGASVNDSITAHRTDINNLQALTGRVDGSTHLGTFTGTTISDDVSIKAALQEIETAVEAGDGNGIYSGSGFLPTRTVATIGSNDFYFERDSFYNTDNGDFWTAGNAKFGFFDTLDHHFGDPWPGVGWKINDSTSVTFPSNAFVGTQMIYDELITRIFHKKTAKGDFRVGDGYVIMEVDSFSFQISNDQGAFFQDNRFNSSGFRYSDDYSSGFTARSLVDKEYVDNAVAGAGGGTVTSVGLTMPSGFSVSGSPVTTSGTLAVTGTLNPSAGGTGLSSLGTANQLLRVNSGASALEYFTPSYLTGNQTITLSGDVTGSGATSISTTIANDAVTYAKLQNVSATNRILGRISSGAGDAEELTGTQATSILDNFTGDSGSGGVKGLVPAPASGDAAANKFLKANGSWEAVGGSISGLTTNMVTKATSGTTIGNSLIYDDGSKVGIGTTSPQQQFQIGFPNANNWFRFDRTSTSYETAFQFTTGNPTGLPADAWFIGQRSVSPVHGLWFFDYSKFGAVGDGVTMLFEPAGNVIISPNGTINMQGGEVNKITKLTSSGTATASITDRYVEFYTATAGGNQTYNLPASPAEGRTIHIFRAELGAHSVTISGNGKNINGSSTYTGLSSLYDSKTLQYNGTEWFIKN